MVVRGSKQLPPSSLRLLRRRQHSVQCLNRGSYIQTPTHIYTLLSLSRPRSLDPRPSVCPGLSFLAGSLSRSALDGCCAGCESEKSGSAGVCCAVFLFWRCLLGFGVRSLSRLCHASSRLRVCVLLCAACLPRVFTRGWGGGGLTTLVQRSYKKILLRI